MYPDTENKLAQMCLIFSKPDTKTYFKKEISNVSVQNSLHEKMKFLHLKRHFCATDNFQKCSRELEMRVVCVQSLHDHTSNPGYDNSREPSFRKLPYSFLVNTRKFGKFSEI